MKLLSCHIENFGKLSNFDYDFNDGLNTIKKENGFGKTTFADFIKAMFYGLETKRNTKNLIDRKKYEPWQGGAFGGNMVFEVNNKKYKMERFFAKKEADDVFKLYDLNTNLESSDFTSSIGEELFKLNKEAFERSTFISGQNIEISMNDSINAKLGNILENENDINSSEKAMKILDEAIKVYKKTGGRGELNGKLLEKTKLEKKIEESKIDEKNLEERKIQNDNIKKKIENLQKEEEDYRKLLTAKVEEEARRAKAEQYKTLVTTAEERKINLNKFKEKMNEETELKERRKNVQKKLENLKERNKELEKSIKKQKNVNIILFIITFIFIITSGLVTYKTRIIISVITLFIFVLFLVSLSSLYKKKKYYLSIKQEKENLENLIDTLNSLYEKQIEEQNNEFERLKKEYETKINAINIYEKQNNVEEFVNSNNSLASEENINKKDIEEKLSIISKEINKLNDEKNYNQNQIEIIESNIESTFDVESDLEELNEKITEMTENLKILEQTKKYLAKAKEQFSSHYLSGMKESFLHNLELINGVEIAAELDVNLDAKINEMGSNKEIRYFSTGYKDLIYICMRLSLIYALFEEEKPFIILDDPFVNLDENKTKNAIDLLKNISNNYQVIYFVCHESRVK